MKLLITGCSGLLGANCLMEAAAQGFEVIGVLRNGMMQTTAATILRADLADPAAAMDTICSVMPDWIIHCAALTDLDWCEMHPQEVEQINARAAAHVAKAATRSGARLVHISTEAVFDGVKGHYTELDNTRPLNVYSRNKLLAEALVLSESVSALVVRPTIYGWNMKDKQSLAEWILDELEAGRGVKGFHDIFITPILANALSRIIFRMMALGLSGIYHVSGSESCSKYEFARSLALEFRLDPSLVTPVSGTAHRVAERAKDATLDTGKITKALREKMPGIQDGLKEFKMLRESGFVARLKSMNRKVENAKA